MANRVYSQSEYFFQGVVPFSALFGVVAGAAVGLEFGLFAAGVSCGGIGLIMLANWWAGTIRWRRAILLAVPLAYFAFALWRYYVQGRLVEGLLRLAAMGPMMLIFWVMHGRRRGTEFEQQNAES